MRWLVSIVVLVLAFTVGPQPAHADSYRVYVTRVDQDLYRDTNSGYFIRTRWCYEFVYYQEALLVYEPYTYSNELIFTGGLGSRCDVTRVFR